MLHHDPITYFNEDFSRVQVEAFNKVDCIQILIENRIDVVKRYCPKVMVKYIPNIVPEFDVEREEKTYHKIINVAALVKSRKQQHIIIEAFNKIKDEFKDWNIEFVGGTKTNREVEYRKEMLEYIYQNDLENNVKFVGVSSNVISNLLKADIFAFPSKSEAFGLALTEAMAVGLPAIGFKSCPAVNEIIIDGYNGFLCEDGIDDFADKLMILMKDEKLRLEMGKNARKSMKKFAPVKIWNEWEDLMNKIIEKRNKL